MTSHTLGPQPTIGNFTCSDCLAQLSPQMSIILVPFSLRAMKVTVKILFMSSTQTSATIGTTTPTIRELPLQPSATSSCALIGTTTDLVSGSHNVFGEKTTQTHMSHEHKLFYPKNTGLNTTSIPSLNLHNQSLLHFFPLSPTHLAFPHSHYPKPILASQPYHSVSDEAVSRTYVRKPLQCLFRPYPKPTPHSHPYPYLHLCNPYYAVKSTFNTSTNPTLCRLHKPTFQHRHNKLRRHLTSINIPRWIPHKSCRLSPPLPTTLQHLQITLTGSYKTLLQLTFQLRCCILSHMSRVQQRTMARCQLMLDAF